MISQSEKNTNEASVSSVEGIGLSDLIRLLNRRCGIVLICFTSSLALAILSYLLMTTKYESSTQILVMKKDSKLAARGAEASNESESRVSEDLLATHMQIVQSRQIVQQALKKYGYDQLPSIVNRLGSDEDAVSFVIDRLYVTRGGTGQAKGAHVLNVKFRHTSPDETQQILSAIVESYKNFLGENFQDVAKGAAELIVLANDKLADDVSKAEAAYREYREQAPLLWKGEESGNIHRERFEELQTSISEIQLKATEAVSRLNVVKKAVAEQDARNASDLERLALIDDNHIERLALLVTVDKGDANTAEFQSTQPARLEGAKAEHESLLMLMLREKTLRTDLGPDHPQVQDVERQIAMIRNFLDEKSLTLGNVENKLKLTPRNLVHAYVRLLEYDMATLESRKKELEARADEAYKSAKELVRYELRAEGLRRDLDNMQGLFDAARARLEEINLVKDYGGFITEVIAPVEIGEKVSPNLLISLLVGAVLGLFIGVGSAGAAEFFDPMFMGPHDVVQSLNLPILSQIPKLGAKKSGGQLVVQPGSALDPSLVAFHRPRSRESETLRGLRTSLLYRLNGAKNKIIQLTSANPGDGKTTITTNLAISFAQAGHNVLLIDGDLRRPTVHKMFGLKPDVGLTSLIMADVEPMDAIQSTEVANLSILTCGSLPSNPAEILSSASFAEVLNLLRQKFDYILIDVPPLMAVADPSIIAAHVDAIILAVRLTKDSRLQVMRSKELLEASKAELIGVIINSFDYLRRHELAAYAYGYAYGYGYGSYNRKDSANVYYHEEDVAPVNGRNGHATALEPPHQN